jgi:flagellar hook-associated protein FlgK
MMEDSKQQIIERWDTFLSKIKARCDEMITQANQGCEMFIPQLLYDTNAIGNAWTGIKNQIYELTIKVYETWPKMEALLNQAGSNATETDVELEKRHQVITYMQWEYEKNRIIALAKAGRQILFNVKKHVNESKMHNCTQCGSPLDINIYSFRAVNIKCESCSSVNTYKPDDRVIALESWVLVPLADEHVLPEKEKEFFLQSKFDNADSRKVTDAQAQELIDSRKATVAKYYQFLINSIPEKEEFYTRQRDERLKWANRI